MHLFFPTNRYNINHVRYQIKDWTMKKLKWLKHDDLAIERRGEVLSRQEYLDWMTFKGGKIVFTEYFGPMVGLKENWEEQGATPEELNFSAFRYRFQESFTVPVNCGRLAPRREKIYEDDKVIHYLDDLGRKLELHIGYATIPLPLDYPVKTMDDWMKIKHKYEFDESRFSPDWESLCRQAIEQGKVITAGIPGGFDEPRQLLGEVNLCYACYESPELIHDILNTIGETAYKVLDRVSAAVKIDQLRVHEDMAGKSGPLWGPVEIREFIKPYYRKIWDMLESRGALIFDQDSDGYMEPVIDAFLDAGINCMHPCEPAAGMDIVKIRRKWGEKIMLIGGIDKYVLTRTKEEIEKELEYKVPPMIHSGGGCILSLDHRLPAEIPLENYKFYISKIWEIIHREEKRL